MACCDRARANGFKLEEDKLRLDKRKIYFFFIMDMVEHSNRLPRVVVDAIPGNHQD